MSLAALSPATLAQLHVARLDLERAALAEILGLAVDRIARHAEGGWDELHDAALIAAIDAWRKAETA